MTAGKIRKRLFYGAGMILCLVLAVLASYPATSNASMVLSDDLTDSVAFGPASGSRIGGAVTENVGDINGDNVDDFVVSLSNSADRGYWVLFGPVNLDEIDFTDLAPSQGYRIATGGPDLVAAAGDQNNDGIGDIVLRWLGNAAVIYGVPDASSLSKCDTTGTSRTRCVDPLDPRASDNSRMGFRLELGSDLFDTQWIAADLEGDDKAELIVTDLEANEIVVLTDSIGDTCPEDTTTCVVAIDELDASQVIRISGPTPGFEFGTTLANVGDTNGDGREDITTSSETDGARPPGWWVIYGQEWDAIPTSVIDLPSESGFEISLPFEALLPTVVPVGDINGNGLDDLAISTLKLVPMSADIYIMFGREGTPDDALQVTPPVPGSTQHIEVDPDFALNLELSSAGDMNGDGGSELVVTNQYAEVDGDGGVGAIVILNSQSLVSESSLTLGWDSPPSDALILTGQGAGDFFGQGLAPAGDIDGDGTADVWVSAPSRPAVVGGNPVSRAGALMAVPASSFYPSGATGMTGGVTTEAATVSGVARANRRASSAYFEYGETAQYGQSSTPEAVGSSRVGKIVDGELSGLTPDTKYHFRIVVENDLGLKGYGPDRTFKTAAVVPDRCEVDSTLPGCPDYVYCEANPDVPECQPPDARLSRLIVAKAQRGKNAVVRATIVNTGDANVSGLRICAAGPKRLVRVGPRCVTQGTLAPGEATSVRFRMRVRWRHRRARRVAVNLRATANGLGKKTAKVGVVVR